jgi:hypothetical protein
VANVSKAQPLIPIRCFRKKVRLPKASSTANGQLGEPAVWRGVVLGSMRAGEPDLHTSCSISTASSKPHRLLGASLNKDSSKSEIGGGNIFQNGSLIRRIFHNSPSYAQAQPKVSPSWRQLQRKGGEEQTRSAQ